MKYRLLYFDDKGRGEPIRLLFHMNEELFEDVRIAYEDWPEFKSSTSRHLLICILIIYMKVNLKLRSSKQKE